MTNAHYGSFEKYYGPVHAVGLSHFASCRTCGATIRYGEDMMTHFSWHADTTEVEPPRPLCTWVFGRTTKIDANCLRHD